MIAIGCDHWGINLKQVVTDHLRDKGIEFRDFGTYSSAACNYPDFAKIVANAVAGGECEKGLLICGTGIGMSIAANKVKGIRAAAVSDSYSVKYMRLHNDANILCLGVNVVGTGLATMLLDIFLTTEFEGGRHKLRVDMYE